MKKVMLVTISVILTLSLISCGSKPAPEEEKPTAPEVVEETPATEENTQDEQALAEEEAKKAAEEEARQAAIEALENAKLAKQKIDEEELAEYDQKNYEEGCALLAEVALGYNGSEELKPELFDSANKALGKFTAVIFNAYKELARQERTEAFIAKKNADSVKAGVARKDAYKDAVEAFTKGDSLYAIQSPEKAYESYVVANESFTGLYEELYEKRAAVQLTVDAAKKHVEEIASFAEEADIKSPITEQIAGIEASDAVLLEEYEFANPADSIVNVPEMLPGENELAGENELSTEGKLVGKTSTNVEAE